MYAKLLNWIRYVPCTLYKDTVKRGSGGEIAYLISEGVVTDYSGNCILDCRLTVIIPIHLHPLCWECNRRSHPPPPTTTTNIARPPFWETYFRLTWGFTSVDLDLISGALRFRFRTTIMCIHNHWGINLSKVVAQSVRARVDGVNCEERRRFEPRPLHDTFY